MGHSSVSSSTSVARSSRGVDAQHLAARSARLFDVPARSGLRPGDLDINTSAHHDASMRTTLTLEEDVAIRLSERAKLTGASFKQVVNETLRAGLQHAEKPAPPSPAFHVTPKAAGFRPGVDVRRLNQLNDELEAETLVGAKVADQKSR